jgi:GWxTD domain-containing protein
LRYKHLAYLFFLLIGCSSLQLSNTDREQNFEYISGSPYFNINGYYKLYEDESPKIFIVSDIFYSSLKFALVEETFISKSKYLLQVKDLESDSIIFTKRDRIELETKNVAEINSEKVLRLESSVDASTNSRFEVSLTVEDSLSFTESTHSFQIDIPKVSEDDLVLGDIQILKQLSNSETHEFGVSASRSLRNDSNWLTFKFQVVNNQDNRSVYVKGRIIKFESDTSIAKSMNNLESVKPIEIKGIDFGSYLEVYDFNRTLNAPEYLDYEFNVPDLNKGNYRFEVFASFDENQEFSTFSSSFFKGIEFNVRSENFPEAISVKEKAESLQYLLTKSQYLDLIQHNDPDIIDNRIQEFWDSKIQNPTISKIIMEKYYSRVKEANKLFSNFKEGWKTDRGMVYILFGEPKRIQKNVNTLVWYYSTNLEDPERTFTFETPKTRNKYYPFDNYILSRSNNYFNIQYRQIQKWLNGLISITS